MPKVPALTNNRPAIQAMRPENLQIVPYNPVVAARSSARAMPEFECTLYLASGQKITRSASYYLRLDVLRHLMYFQPAQVVDEFCLKHELSELFKDFIISSPGFGFVRPKFIYRKHSPTSLELDLVLTRTPVTVWRNLDLDRNIASFNPGTEVGMYLMLRTDPCTEIAPGEYEDWSDFPPNIYFFGIIRPGTLSLAVEPDYFRKNLQKFALNIHKLRQLFVVHQLMSDSPQDLDSAKHKFEEIFGMKSQNCFVDDISSYSSWPKIRFKNNLIIE